MSKISDREGIFAGDDPFKLFQDWLDEATNCEPNDPNAAALATCDSSGMPNTRIVLVKQVDKTGFIFFTNYQSRKGQELTQSGYAAFVMHWKSLRRQIRVRGRVEKVSKEISNRYFHSRSLDSQFAAMVSQQSRPLGNRGQLLQEFETLKENSPNGPILADHWGGFRITPTEFEFWSDGTHRLHDRFRWSRESVSSEWLIERLYP